MHELIAPKEVKISRIREIESLSPNNYKELKIQNTNEEYLSFFLKDVPFERGIEPGSTAYVEKSNQIFLRNSCIDNIRFSNDKEKYIYLNPNYYDACTVENEDVLFCTDANIGDCCLYLGVNEKAVYSSGIVKLNFKNEKYKYYVMGFIRDDYFREQLNTLTPKGSTIRHSRDLLLNCRIPICFEDWIFSLYENLIKNIAYTEYICNMKMRQTEEMIDSELLVREYPYQNPSIKKLTEKSRLDSGIYSKEVYQWQKNIENYKNGYTDLEGFGFRTKRGPSLQVRDLGRSIQTENYRKGYNVLIYPIHRIVFTFVILLFASCKLITSNFSERIFKSSIVGSAIGSPSNSLTVVSSSFAKIISILESGTDKPFSHFDTVCLTTFSLIASSDMLPSR